MCCIAGLLFGAIYILIRAINADNMRMRLGASSATCGLAALASLVFIANIPVSTIAEMTAMLHFGGMFSFGFGAAAIILSIVSFFYGRKSLTGSPFFAIVGSVTGLVAFCAGFMCLLAGSGVIHYLRGPQNIWRSEKHPIEVVLPTRNSVPVADSKAVAKYISDQPSFSATVIDVRVIENEEEFKKLLKYGQDVKTSLISTDVKEDSGINRHGQSIWLFLGTAKRNGISRMYGMSITRVKDVAVSLRFEGDFTTRFDPEQAEEMRTLRRLGEDFLGSVRPSVK